MASANSDQENVLLPSDEGSPSAPPPNRRPIEALLTVGICVAAAGLAGAVVMGRSPARAPAEIKHPWAVTRLEDGPEDQNWKKYLSDECHDLLEALEWEAEKAGRRHEGHVGEVECQWPEQTCTVYSTDHGRPENGSKCFPATCNPANILKGIEEDMASMEGDQKDGRYATNVSLECMKNTTAEDVLWKKYLSDECLDHLSALDKDAKKEGRKYQGEPGETVECKDSEQRCSVDFTMEGMGPGGGRAEMCFPATCKQANILKGMEEFIDAEGRQYSGLTVTCVNTTTKTEGYILDGVDRECTGSHSNRITLLDGRPVPGVTVEECYKATKADDRCADWFEVSHDSGGWCMCYETDCSSSFYDYGEDLYKIVN